MFLFFVFHVCYLSSAVVLYVIIHIVFRRKKTREEIKQCWYWRLYLYTFRMFVNAEATEFVSFEVGLQPDDVFLPPKDIQCYYGPTESD